MRAYSVRFKIRTLSRVLKWFTSILHYLPLLILNLQSSKDVSLYTGLDVSLLICSALLFHTFACMRAFSLTPLSSCSLVKYARHTWATLLKGIFNVDYFFFFNCWIISAHPVHCDSYIQRHEVKTRFHGILANWVSTASKHYVLKPCLKEFCIFTLWLGKECENMHVMVCSGGLGIFYFFI